MTLPTDRDWKQFYRNRYAEDWELFSDTLAGEEYHNRYLENCLRRVREVQPSRVLEVGVGRGNILSRLAGGEMRLAGCDLSAGNLQASAQRFRDEDEVFGLSHADAENLPFCEAAFDAVYSSSMLWYLPHPGRAVAEMCRVTRPGGRVVYDTINVCHVTTAAFQLSRAVQRLMGRERGRTRAARPGEVQSWAEPYCSEVRTFGSFVLLPVTLPLVGERANLFHYFPGLARTMTQTPLKYLAYKLLVVATRA